MLSSCQQYAPVTLSYIFSLVDVMTHLLHGAALINFNVTVERVVFRSDLGSESDKTSRLWVVVVPYRYKSSLNLEHSVVFYASQY